MTRIVTTNVHEWYKESQQRQKTTARQHEKGRRGQNGKVQHRRERVHSRFVILLHVSPERIILRTRRLVVPLLGIVPGWYSRHRHCVVQRAHLKECLQEINKSTLRRGRSV